MTGHLTEDDLINRWYGLDSTFEAHERHLLSCAACADKLRAFEQRRAAVVESQAVPAAFLAAQRSRILERVERSSGFRMPWVPAVLAGALALAVALVPRMVQAPAPAPEKAVQQEVAEDQLFLELFSLEAAEEPRAASPIRGLFEQERQ
jgi:hypothetical protein